MTQELGQVRYNRGIGQWERFDGRTWAMIVPSLPVAEEILVLEVSGGAGTGEGVGE